MKKQHILVGSAILIAFGSGGVGGYFFAKKRLTKELDAILQSEIDRTKEYYSRLNKTEDFETPVEAAKTLGVQVEEDDNEFVEYQKIAKTYTDSEAPSSEVVIRNVFDSETSEIDPEEMVDVDEEWDYEAEVAKRQGAQAYILSEEEYFANEPENTQASMTYFEGDGVLVDSADKALTTSEMMRLIGHVNNLRFGHGSNDPNLVYIRNDKLDLDMEIALSRGKYAEEVLGYIEERQGDDG